VIGIQVIHVILEFGCQYILGILDFLYKVKKIMHYVIVMYVHLSACLLACDVLLAPKLIDLFTVWYTFTKTELYWLIMKPTVLIECCVVHALQYFVLFCFVLFV
jgi:hypothetical protein